MINEQNGEGAEGEWKSGRVSIRRWSNKSRVDRNDSTGSRGPRAWRGPPPVRRSPSR